MDEHEGGGVEAQVAAAVREREAHPGRCGSEAHDGVACGNVGRVVEAVCAEDCAERAAFLARDAAESEPRHARTQALRELCILCCDDVRKAGAVLHADGERHRSHCTRCGCGRGGGGTEREQRSGCRA